MKDRTTSDCVRILKQVAAIEPPPEALQRALAQTRKTLDSPTSATQALPVDLRRGGQRLLRIVAATAAALVVAVGGACLIFFAPSGATSAFAKVQSAIEKVSCVSCSVEVLESPKDVVAKSGTSLVDLERNRSRFESADGEDIYVTDGKRRISMVLYPNEKRAVVMQSSSAAELPSFTNFLDGLRNCDPDLVEQLKDANFDGRRVERYRILPEAPIAGGVNILVSVDPKTRLPVRIESSTDLFGEPLRIENNNFSFEQCDPALFETVPPQGYQVDEPVESTRPAIEWPQGEELLEAPTAVNPGEQAPIVEFRLADITPSDIFSRPAKLDSGIEVFLHKDTLLTLDDIADIRVSRRQGRAELHLEFENDGAKRLGIATQQNIGKRLALVLNSKIIVAPEIMNKISTSARLTGDFSDEVLRQLSTALVLTKPHPQNTKPLGPVLKVEQTLDTSR